MAETNHELEFLLSLDGFEFQMAAGYLVKIEAHIAPATRNRPKGIKYSLTLHDPGRQRIYGMDNAHSVRRHTEYDHRHLYGSRKVVAYRYRGPAELLADFYSEVERILWERGML
jgi:hypothetical protein